MISLPIDDFIPQILDLLKTGDSLVLTAAPGAGKTTRLPPACLQAVKGKVLVLEPRRMAAVAAASRIAEENGWTAGQEVGWQVRFDNKTTPETRLIFLTEALLARKMITDPELTGVDLVILDEFHERSQHTDLALGLLQELRAMGREIKLIVMSATLAAEKISAYLGGAPIVAVPGRLFEQTVTHQKNPLILNTDFRFIERIADLVREAQHGTKNDILVFLPGVGEIERVRENLQDWAHSAGIDLVPLHGSLKLDEQRHALRKGSRRRIVLATNIAESSVTVDGVDTVVDSGLARVSRFDARTGFGRLELSRISLSSATQRAGRSARQFPGRCFRFWNKHDELSMSVDEVPEIQRADLGEALLFLSSQGVRDFVGFSWFEAPSSALIKNAERSLRGVRAINEKNEITPLGRKLLRYPLSPRLGALMLAAEEIGSKQALRTAARLAALAQEKDFVSRDTALNHKGDRFECDLTLRLHLLDQVKPRVILQSAEQLERLSAHKGTDATITEDILVRKLLLKSFADRLCRRRGTSDRGLMVGGRGVKLEPDSLVSKSEFFIAFSGVEGSSDAETAVSLACGMNKDFILQELASLIERKKDLWTDPQKGQVYSREQRFLWDLPIDEPSLKPASREEVASRLPDLLVSRFDDVLKKNEGLGRWFERWNFLRHHDARAKEFDFDAQVLRDIFESASLGKSSMEEVLSQDLIYYIESALPQNLSKLLQKEVPDRIEVPTGNRMPVHYSINKDPYLEVRLQEIFGWQETPRVLEGKIPVTLHLLGPNFRPVQVTADLKSFWKNGYPEIRKELRTRYPKHSWPDDPYTATPEAKGRRRF